MQTLRVKHNVAVLFACLLVLGMLSCTAKAPAMKITSTAFADGQPIPSLYTCDAQNISPSFEIDHVPAPSKSLALIIDDPDAPAGLWMHWLVWNINPTTRHLPENTTPPGAVVGTNSFANSRYEGPCPPNGRHRYFVRLYALDQPLTVPAGSTRPALDRAMTGHILSTATLMGTYSRH